MTGQPCSWIMAFAHTLSAGIRVRQVATGRSCVNRVFRVHAAGKQTARIPTGLRGLSMSTSSEADVALRAEELRGPEGIFTKIISKEIPSDIVYEDDEFLAFRDIKPQAPKHLVVIPKRRIALLSDAKEDDALLLGKLMLTAAEVARREKLDAGYRVIINNGYDGLQSIGHIHAHVVGGRKLKWGPF